MGGECNYVLRVARPDMRLQFVPDEDWKSPAMMSWAADDIARLLSDAERVLTETAHRLRLPVTVIQRFLDSLMLGIEARLESSLAL